jgi:hypothetical protein
VRRTLANPDTTAADYAELLREIDRNGGPQIGMGPAPGAVECYVTLDQMAATVSRSKRTLERLKTRKRHPLPAPDVEGGGGRPDEWLWSRIRPWLAQEFGKQLPEHFFAARR